MLFKSWNKHNHALELKNGSLEINEKIIKSFKELRSITQDAGKMTKSINKKFEKNFDASVIRYQLQKLKNDEYGNLAENAPNLITLLEEDKMKRIFFFEKSNIRE